MTLFSDVTSVWSYRDHQPESSYPEDFEQQLCDAISDGHDVQLHLHPHWSTTTFDGTEWQVDDTYYKLSDLGFGARKFPTLPTAEEVIARGCSHLRELLLPIDPAYECIAFRAGGYGIQPNERQVFEALLSAGIRIESSVVPGFKYSSNVNAIDFTRLPAGINYYLSAATGLDTAAVDGLFEIPIPAYRESLADTAKRRALAFPAAVVRELRIRAQRVGTAKARGRGIQNTSIVKRVADRLFSRGMFMLELSGPILDVPYLVEGTSRYIRENATGEGPIYISPSSHPKDVFEGTLDGIRDFWLEMKQRYPRARSISYQEAAREIASRTHASNSL